MVKVNHRPYSLSNASYKKRDTKLDLISVIIENSKFITNNEALTPDSGRIAHFLLLN